MNNFNGSALKCKSTGNPRSVGTQENDEQLTQACKKTSVFGTSHAGILQFHSFRNVTLYFQHNCKKIFVLPCNPPFAKQQFV